MLRSTLRRRLASAFVALALAGPASAADLMVAIDGDTIAFGKQRIRLYGVDAPERNQTCRDPDGTVWACGYSAYSALTHILVRGYVTCYWLSEDRYGRIVATCQVAGVDVGAELVRQGWAFEYDRYSDGRYHEAERAARAERRGIWAGWVMPPWDWRRRKSA